MQEQWKIIDGKGFENYMVSNLGNVKSINYRNSRKEMLLTPIIHKKGYSYVNLRINKKKVFASVHRLVANAFIDNKDKKPQVNHINEIKHDNNHLNLEWVTEKENANHGTGIDRSIVSNSINVIQKTLSGKIVAVWLSATEAGRYNYQQSEIWRCCVGVRKTYKGFTWSY